MRMYSRNNPGLILLIPLMFAFFMTSGCREGTDDLERYMNKIKSRPAGKIEPIPQFKSLPDYKYPEAEIRRNPFKPEDKTTDSGDAPVQNRPKQLLEALPLETLKFVGTLKCGVTVWALIQQPDGIIARIEAGEYMGQDAGRVLVVEDKLVKLEETVNVGGKWMKKIRRIQLNHQSERVDSA